MSFTFAVVFKKVLLHLPCVERNFPLMPLNFIKLITISNSFEVKKVKVTNELKLINDQQTKLNFISLKLEEFACKLISKALNSSVLITLSQKCS